MEVVAVVAPGMECQYEMGGGTQDCLQRMAAAGTHGGVPVLVRGVGGLLDLVGIWTWRAADLD